MVEDGKPGLPVVVHNPPAEVLNRMARVKNIRWVAEDLTGVAQVLAKSGVRLRLGLCLGLAERALDAFSCTVADPSMAVAKPPAERFLVVKQRISDSGWTLPLIRLVNQDSANALLAGELNAHGIPWNGEEYRRLMIKLLHKPERGDAYPRLADLDKQISKLFDGAKFDWRTEWAEVLDGEQTEFGTAKLTRLQDADHPAVPLVLRWRELYTLATHFGYAWEQRWTSKGHWRPRFRPASTVSGRWTAEGGGLQLPRELRSCVHAEAGRVLIRADLRQLEPRMWAHLSADGRLIKATAHSDLYAEIGKSLGMNRDTAKAAVLAAMYDDQSPLGRRTRGVLKHRFPRAMRSLEVAMARGLNGETIRTKLGRTTPPSDELIRQALQVARESWTQEQQAAVRKRGRQVRNFYLQAPAAELACAIAADLREALRCLDARLLLFLHDEFLIDAGLGEADKIERLLPEVARAAADRVLGPAQVFFPLTIRRGQNWAVASGTNTK
ncbi:DNA polymerase [Crossiella sp. CA-258035]|uniref:DNA polymerase n=1 Tax=Crossiella sp. CA-258035 TaxID=2981138 RepID=UPI0024BC34B3|nr:DNA polymerase [Crossiella sp. CA-258035]WHT23565.1 DNA polymerase [Crossiella sp. CA-258035]